MKVTKDQKNYIGRDLEAMSAAKNYYNWIISEFGKYIKGDVAEVGAGSGTFTDYILKKNPSSILTVEPSEEMYPLLKKHVESNTKISTYNGFFEDTIKGNGENLDSVLYINVLEHVEHDFEELKHVYKSLRKGGYVCIYVPALPWIYGSFDEQVGHYRRYTKKDLRKKLEDAGFHVEMIRYSDIIGILPWLFSFRILKRKDLGTKQVGIYDKYIIPLIKTQEKLVKSPIGKNLWAVGRK